MKKILMMLIALALVAPSCLYAGNKKLVAGPGVRIIAAQHPDQPYDMAAKLQWNPHDQVWDKVLVLYNGCANPPKNHPVWAYLESLQPPRRKPQTVGENLSYKPFRLNALCTGATPLSSGRPLRVSFDQNQLGHYLEKDYFRDWNCPEWGMGLNNLAIVNGTQSRTGRDHALRVTLKKGLAGCVTDDSCINWKPKIGAEMDSMYYSYWFKFPEHFDFVLGGKLPGIGSDRARSGGGKADGRNGWSVRAMWNREGKLGQYVYHMDQPGHFGDFIEWDMPKVERGKWYKVKTFVRLNAPGKRDGMVHTWINGRTVLDKREMRFRYGDDLKIERFLFSVFFGGSTAEWAPSHDQYLYLDDFTLSANGH